MRPNLVALVTGKTTEEHRFVRLRRWRPCAVNALHYPLADSRDLLGRDTESGDVEPKVRTPFDQPLFWIEPYIADLTTPQPPRLAVVDELLEYMTRGDREGTSATVEEEDRALPWQKRGVDNLRLVAPKSQLTYSAPLLCIRRQNSLISGACRCSAVSASKNSGVQGGGGAAGASFSAVLGQEWACSCRLHRRMRGMGKAEVPCVRADLARDSDGRARCDLGDAMASATGKDLGEKPCARKFRIRPSSQSAGSKPAATHQSANFLPNAADAGDTEVSDYLSQRQNVLAQDPAKKAELNTYLETVADHFGLRWLEKGSGNPVQDLWQARHAQATNEMLTLGHAVRNLVKADPAWTRHQISKMKTGSVGERAGAAFEILGLNLFSGPDKRIVPAPANRPGFDGSVFFDDGSSLIVSIKNYGISSHESASYRRRPRFAAISSGPAGPSARPRGS